jgi:hypothetical protein
LLQDEASHRLHEQQDDAADMLEAKEELGFEYSWYNPSH